MRRAKDLQGGSSRSQEDEPDVVPFTVHLDLIHEHYRLQTQALSVTATFDRLREVVRQALAEYEAVGELLDGTYALLEELATGSEGNLRG